MKDEHVRDAAQGVAEDVTQDTAGDVAEGVLGAAIFQRRNPRPTHARPHACP